MKTVNMAGFNATQRERLLQEVFILGRLHHPNIVKLYEVYETSNAMYLIMEMLSGGELYTRLVNSPSALWLLSSLSSGQVLGGVHKGNHWADSERD